MQKLSQLFWPTAFIAYFIAALFSLGYFVAQLGGMAIGGATEILPEVLVLVVER